MFPGHVFDKAVKQAFIYDGQIKPRKQFYGVIQENKDICFPAEQLVIFLFFKQVW